MDAIWTADMATTIDPIGGELSLGSGPVDGDPQMSARYLLTLIRTDKGMHIDILATIGALLLGFLALLGSRRRRSRSKAFLFMVEAAYTTSYTLVSYTIGLIQSFEGPNPASSQLLWAVGLLLLLGSADAISAFSRRDVEQSKGMQAQHILQTLLVLWLLLTRSSISYWTWILTLFFLLCWVYSILKMTQRIKAMRMASSAHGLVRSAKVVADYMKKQQDAEANGHYNPKDMTGYRYLVLGEDEDPRPPSRPPYSLLPDVPVDRDDKVVTIDMIWKHEDGKLLSSGDERARALKDTCLSFALFKLLKRRFCGFEVAEAGGAKARDLVFKGLLAGDDYERAFRVVEVELSFLYGFFYTKYPVLFPGNRALGVIRFFYLLGFLKMLRDFTREAAWLAKHRHETSPYFIFTIFNDLLFVAMIMAIDVVQQLATGCSNWAVVHLVCDYVRRRKKKAAAAAAKKPRWWRQCSMSLGIRRALVTWVAARRARKPTRDWDNKLGQYSLLDSLDYRPYITNALSKLTVGLMEPTGQGRKRQPEIQLPWEVKEAVLHSLRESQGRLTSGSSAVCRSVVVGQAMDGGCDLRWACDLPTHTHRVLVWHIATTLCVVEEDATADAPHPKEKDGHVVVEDEDTRSRRRHRLVAASLSGYCAYLLAFVPEMLPDHSYVAKQILDGVVQEAQRRLTDDDKGSMDMRERCRAMLSLRPESNAAGSLQMQDKSILDLGARLGKELLGVGRVQRWKLLAEFWAELVLFLAPSDNADVHVDSLARGGEFMTHLWALLNNAGILERTTHIPA